MTYAFDRVWERINNTAVDLAKRKSVPSTRHAEAIVLQIIREEAADLPTEHTVSSLAEELRRATHYQTR